MEFEFNGHLDKKTFFKAILLAAKENRKRDIIFLCIGLVILGGLVTYYFIQDVGSAKLNNFTHLRLIIPLVIIEYFLLFPYFSPFVLATKSWKDPSLHKQLSGKVSSQAIEYSGISKTIEWIKVNDYHISDDLLILLTIDKDIVILPQWYFTSEDQWKKVILLTNYKVSKIH